MFHFDTNNNNLWKANLFRITFLVSTIIISYLASDAIAYSISTLLTNRPTSGGLFAVVVGLLLFLFKIFSYLFFKILITLFFSLIGWFLLLLVEKSRLYRYLLEKMQQYTVISGWLIWMGISIIPLLFLYVSIHYSEIEKTAYNNPYKNTKVELNGHIDKTVSYKIKAIYRTKNNARECKSGLFDEYYKTKVHTYHPRITATLHSLNIPLDAEKKSVCQYQISTIEMCLTKINDKNDTKQMLGCYQLLISDNLKSDYMFDGYHYQEAKDNKLTIQCGSLNNLSPKCGQNLKNRTSITQYLKSGNQNFFINIYDLAK